MFPLFEHALGAAGAITGLCHHLVFFNQQFAGGTLQQRGIQSDAATARIQLRDQRLNTVALIEHLADGPQAAVGDGGLVQQAADSA